MNLHLKPIAVAILASSFILGCTEPESRNGTASGGGGYGDESANWVLTEAVTRLTKKVRQASPVIFNDVPSGVTQKKLLAILSDVKRLPNTMATRDNRDLIFDYVNDKTNQYIYATHAFFKAYAGVPFYFGDKVQLLAKIEEVEIRLLHEAAHIFNIGVSEKTDFEARRFALTMSALFINDTYGCSNEESHPEWKRYITKEDEAAHNSSTYLQNKRYHWLINRPTSEGILNTRLSPNYVYIYHQSDSLRSLDYIRQLKSDLPGDSYDPISSLGNSGYHMLNNGKSLITLDFKDTRLSKTPNNREQIIFENQYIYRNAEAPIDGDTAEVIATRRQLIERVIITSDKFGKNIKARVEFAEISSAGQRMTEKKYIDLLNKVDKKSDRPVIEKSRTSGSFPIDCSYANTTYSEMAQWLTKEIIKRGY